MNNCLYTVEGNFNCIEHMEVGFKLENEQLLDNIEYDILYLNSLDGPEIDPSDIVDYEDVDAPVFYKKDPPGPDQNLEFDEDLGFDEELDDENLEQNEVLQEELEDLVFDENLEQNEELEEDLEFNRNEFNEDDQNEELIKDDIEIIDVDVDENENNVDLLLASWGYETINYFIDKPIKTYINTNIYQKIGNFTAIKFSDEESDYIKNLLNKINNTFDNINFEIVNNYFEADLIISGSEYKIEIDYYGYYFDEEIEGSMKSIIFLNPPKFENNSESEINFKLLHEIGHFLGLKHPFDCDGVCSDDLTTADTVMEYKGSNIYPSFFTELDILAINKLWD